MYHINDVMLYKLQNFDLFSARRSPGISRDGLGGHGGRSTTGGQHFPGGAFFAARRKKGANFSMNREIF